jgi:fructose-1,6-bisphosphatase/inositol monophosphatase family enzyme
MNLEAKKPGQAPDAVSLEKKSTQAEFPLDLPPKIEALSRGELIDRAGQASLLYAERVTPLLHEKIRRGEGRQVITTTQEGRPGEEMIELDQPGENMLKSIIREVKLPTVLMSENTPEPTEFGNGATEKVYTYQDPLDNSSPQKRGLDTPPYSVKGDYDKDGNPISASIVDIKNKQAYINIGHDNFLIDLETKEKKTLSKSQRTTLKDKNSTLASFRGEKEYSEKFDKYFGALVHAPDRERKAYFYDGGGAFIYGLLASGAVDAYIMFDEPMSEILPGLPLALAAGCTVVSVNEDGTYQDFKFDPKALKENHKLYAEGTVPLFIAAATPEIRDELITAYIQAKNKIIADEKRKEEVEKELSELRDFKNSRPAEEFEIFRASKQIGPATNN